VVVIDPCAGQSLGIGGFKPVSEIGEAFKAGHPVYFAGFAATQVAGQRVEDVARVVIADAPLSYWGGVHGKNQMRYLGGVLGGTWLDPPDVRSRQWNL
jgi:2-keto-3-deoxy-6-phosphogluconate aldolase